jgi:hypothetical protein
VQKFIKAYSKKTFKYKTYSNSPRSYIVCESEGIATVEKSHPLVDLLAGEGGGPNSDGWTETLVLIIV